MRALHPAVTSGHARVRGRGLGPRVPRAGGRGETLRLGTRQSPWAWRVGPPTVAEYARKRLVSRYVPVANIPQCSAKWRDARSLGAARLVRRRGDAGAADMGAGLLANRDKYVGGETALAVTQR